MIFPHRAVCFDLGGVLVNICHTWGETLSEDHNFDARPLGEYRRFHEYQNGAIRSEEYLEGLAGFLNVSSETARNAHQRILKRPFPSAESLVQKFKQMGMICGVLSNTNALHWSELQNPSLYPYVRNMDVQIASHVIGISKPDPNAFKLFENKIGAFGKHILFFDDNLENIQVAQSIGWDARLVMSSVDPPNDIQRLFFNT